MCNIQVDDFALIPANPEFLRLLVAGDFSSAGQFLNVIVDRGWPHDAEAIEGLTWHLKALDRDPDELLWRIRLIVLCSTRNVIGAINLKGQPDESGTVEIGWGVNQEYRGRGIATRATQLVMQWAFSQPKVKKIIATISLDNVASMQVAERVGMRKTSYTRRDLPVWEIEKGWLDLKEA